MPKVLLNIVNLQLLRINTQITNILYIFVKTY